MKVTGQRGISKVLTGRGYQGNELEAVPDFMLKNGRPRMNRAERRAAKRIQRKKGKQ